MTIKKMTPAATTDSTKLNAQGSLLKLAFILCLLSGACSKSPVPEAGSSGVQFHIEQSNARIWQRSEQGDFNYIGVAGQRVPVAASDGRDIRFRFSVPLWRGGEYPNWGQSRLQGQAKDEVELDDFSETVPASDLNRMGAVVPKGGNRIELPLPPMIAFQAWTLAHKSLTVLGLLACGLAIFAATRWRKILARLAPPAEAPDASMVGEYRLSKKIGEGGMGEVWAATSVSRLDCAIKFVRKELAEEPDFKRRFEREIKACLPLHHPNMLKLYGYGVAQDGRLYTVSELLKGSTLKEVIREGKFDPPQLASLVLEQVGDALHYLHIKGLVHRDVKPDNIFLCDDGTLKLMDMGLIHGEALTLVTRTGFMVGTPAYMPPEQMNAGGAVAASDQYALGVILYEILAGRRPFTQPDPIMLAYQHMHVAPAPPREANPRITPEIEQCLLRMLEKKPEARFGNLKKVQRALEPMSFTSWKDTGEETRQSQINGP